MDQNYIAPASALKKLKKARSLSQTVYLYGATGYGKTELVRQYLSGRRYIYLSCEELPWEAGALPSEEPGRQNRRIVVIDNLHRLKSEELRREILALEKRKDIWLILIGRSPLPTWLMSRHIQEVFVVISENDLRMGRDEITAYLDARGVTHTEEDIQYLQNTAEGNAYILHHVALRMKEGEHPGPKLQTEIREAFASYLENVVLVRWDSDLLEFLMQVSVVDEFTLELAEMISGNLHVTALLEQAAEAGNFISQEDGTYRLRPVLIDALRNRALKVYGRERVKDLKYNAALYYEMHDEVVPALKLFEECGKTERIKNLLIRNARMNPGNGHYYELRRYYFNMDEREIEDSPVLMAGMSMLHSMLMDDEKSEYWYEKLKAFATNAKGGVRREALSRLAYLDIGLPHRGSRDVLEIIKNIPALLFDKGNRLPEFSVTSNLPSTMNGGKDFCHWSPDDTKLAKTVGPLVERVLGSYASGTVLAKNIFSVYCLQAFRLHKKKNIDMIFRYWGKRSNRLPHFFGKGKDCCRASRFLPLLFRLQTDLLELIKGNIELNFNLIISFHTDSLYKLRYNHFLGLKVTVVKQLGPVHQFSVVLPHLFGARYQLLQVCFCRFNLLFQLLDLCGSFLHNAVKQIHVQTAGALDNPERFSPQILIVLLLLLVLTGQKVQLGLGNIYFPALTLFYQFLGRGRLYLLKLDADNLLYQVIQL